MDDKEKLQWREHAKEMQLMREKRCWQFREVIRHFRKMGFEVKEISAYQIRFADCIDIYPANKRYYDLKSKKRGDLRGSTFEDFLKKYFNLG
jgi:hypothetical protein